MNTSQLVTYIGKFPANNNRTRTEILDVINQIQNELLVDDSNFNRVQPDPYLVTTDGIYEYELPVNVRRVSRLYTRENPNDGYGYNGMVRGNGFLSGFTDDLGDQISNAVVTLTDSTEPGVTAKIIFNENQNPGATTTFYQMEQYVWPEQLETEANALTIPLAHRTQVLYSGVMRRLVREEYGNGGDWESIYADDMAVWSKYSTKNRIIGKSSTQFYSV